MSNILNSNELVTISILQQIKIDLLEEKARLQRNGNALEETYIEDAPEDFPEIKYQNEDQDGNVIVGTVSFDELLEEQLNAPSPIEKLVQRAEHLEISGVNADDAINSENAEPRKAIKDKQPTFFARFNAWLIARTVWHVKKSQLEYEHERTKADVVNMCYGIDFAIKLINAEIERQKSGKAIQVEIPKVKDVSVL